MNIALFASAFHPHVGGVEELCRQLAHEYRRRGDKAVVFTERWPRSLPEDEEYEGIPVHRLPFRVPSLGIRSQIRYLVTIPLTRRRLLALVRYHRIDLIHVQCVSSNAFYALKVQAALRLPLVVTMQGELSMDAERIFDRLPFARAVLRDSLRRADAVTACSRQTLEEAEAFFGEPFGKKGRVIYNGIAAGDLNDVRRHETARPYILAIGRHVAQKGFDVLLHAMKRLVTEGLPCDLILAGDGAEHQALRTLAAKLGLAGGVIFPGRVDHATAMSLFAGCEVFVLPSRHEPFGIVNLEAMLAGKPIVASRVGGVPEIVVENENGLLVPPGDPVALAGALGELLSNAALRERLGANGREQAKRFTWPRIADEYAEVYASARGDAPTTGKTDRQTMAV